MGFRNIPVEVKCQALLEVLDGQKILPTAVKYGINRDSLSDWMKKVREKTKEWLELEKRGPKEKKPKVSQEEKMIERLNRLLEKKEVQIALLEEGLEKIKGDEPRPEKCDLCGCKKIYKDGNYLIKPKRLFDLLRKRTEPVIIPQFACANCGHSLYLESDRALFFPGEGK